MSEQEKLERRIAKAIQKQVAWFNGWRCEEEEEWKSCLLAAKSTIKIINKAKKEVPLPKWKCPVCFSEFGVKRTKKYIFCKKCNAKIEKTEGTNIL